LDKNTIKEVPPNSLPDQMLYELKCAIESTGNILKNTEYKIQFEKSGYKDFKNSFTKHYSDMLRVMLRSDETPDNGDYNRPLDAHKLAAISIIAILLVRPLYNIVDGKRNDAHLYNELTAFLMALNIIRNDQINRSCGGNEEKRIKLRDGLGSLSLPPIISDSGNVTINTLRAFSFLARTIRSGIPVDISWLLSSFLFYIDVYSFNEVDELSKSIA